MRAYIIQAPIFTMIYRPPTIFSTIFLAGSIMLFTLTGIGRADTWLNNTCSTAEYITLDYSGTGTLSPNWGDSNDYYYFDITANGTVTISLTGSGANGITTRLYNTDCSTLLATGNSIIFSVTAATRYKIRLSASNGNRAYTLTVTFTPAAALPTPVADLRFDQCRWDGSLGEAIDSSGNGYDATAQGATTTDSTDSALCQAAVFNGDPDYLNSAQELSPLRGTSSLSMWIKTSQVGNNTAWRAPGITGIEEKGGTDDIFWGWLDATGHIGLTVGNNNNTKSATAINDGVWHHIVLTRNATTGAYAIYIDRNLDVSGTLNTGIIGNTFTSIGRIEDTGGTPNYFIGRLDEVKIFDQALSLAEVQSIYDNEAAGRNYDGSSRVCPACPLAEFRLDECSYSGGAGEVLDNTGVYNGQAYNSLTTDTPGQIARFANLTTNRHHFRTDNPAIPITVDWTVTAWFKMPFIPAANTPQRYYVFAAVAGGGDLFYLDKQNNFRWGVYTTTAGARDGTYQFGNLSAGWHQLAIIGQGGQTDLYIDNSATPVDTINRQTTGQLTYIGASYDDVNTTNTQGFGAPLDEVLIFNSAITTAQLDLIYTYQLAGKNLDGSPRPTVSCTATPDHFSITHNGTAINCMPEDITIAAHDASHNILTNYTGTISLATSTARGDWSQGTATGTLVTGAADSGLASYTFVTSDNGSATLQLKDTHVETVNINVAEGTVTETSGTALASEDADLTFTESGFLFYGDSTANAIGSQICGKSSDTGYGSQTLEIAAIRTNDQTGACEAALTGATTIDIGFECRDPATCTANQLQFTGLSSVALTGTANGGSQTYSSVSLDFGTATDFTAPFTINYQDSGQIRLLARYNIPLTNGNPSGTYMLGTSNEFISRPFGLLVDDTLSYLDDTATCSSATCQVAGQDFTVTSTAYCLTNSADDSNNNGIPDIFEDDDPAVASTISNNATLDTTALAANFGNEATPATATLTNHLIAPSTGAAGTFSATATSFSNGSGSSTDANWTEVGVSTVQADSSYFTTAIRGISAQLGRFIPARLNVTANTPVFTFFCSASGVDFNYLGQEFGFATDPVLTITAVTSSGTTTQNYGNSFWKFNSLLTNRFYTNNQSATVATLTLTTNGGNATLAGANNYDGLGTLTISGDGLTYNKPASPEAPFAALIHLDLTAADLTDNDGVCYDPNTDATCDGFQIQDITSTANNAYGRLLVRDNYGPEDEDINNSPFSAQYFDGSTWRTNSYDDCSTALAFCSTPAGHPVSAILPDPLSAGLGTLNVANNGVAETVQVCPIAPAWLTDLSNCTTPDDTCGVFTFGIYRGNDRIINWREIVR